MSNIYDGAKEWLNERGFEVSFEKDGHTIIGKLTEAKSCKPGTSSPYDIQEIAVVVATQTSIDNNMAQARLNALLPWKERKQGRWIAVVIPRGTPASDLLSLKDANQIVGWPT